MSLHAGTSSAIANGSIAYAKIQNEAATTLLGNPTGSPASPSEVSLGGGNYFSGTTLYGASNHPGYVSGCWYSTIPSATVAIGVTFSANAIKLVPFVISKPITPSALGARVTTLATSGNFQLAIYANNAATGRPTGAALYSTGNISSNATGAVSAAASGSGVLTPGTYWAAINQDNGTAVFQTLAAASLSAAYLIGSSTLATATSATATVAYNLSVTQTFGTWPDLTSGSFTEQTSSTTALVFMKAA